MIKKSNRNSSSNFEEFKYKRYLPEGQQTIEGFKQNIRCPQFYQALSTFSEVTNKPYTKKQALSTENLYNILQSFNLDINNSEHVSKGIEIFLKAISKKYPKKQNNIKN